MGKIKLLLICGENDGIINLNNVSSMKTKNYYNVILRSDSDEESFKDSSLRSE